MGKEVNRYFSGIMDKFEQENELTEFLATLAKEECGELYEIAEGSGSSAPMEPKASDAFGDVTSMFMTAGFAVGFLYGQMFDTPNKVKQIVAELKKRMKEEGLLVSAESKKS